MKKVIFVSILALIMLFTVAPVMAAPATKVPATVTSSTTGMTLGDWWVTDGGVVQIQLGRAHRAPWNSNSQFIRL